MAPLVTGAGVAGFWPHYGLGRLRRIKTVTLDASEPFRFVGYPVRVHAGPDAISKLTEEVDRVIQQVGGQSALQQVLAGQGLTLAEYRDMRRNDIRLEQVQQMFMQTRLRNAAPIELTEDELLAAFQAARGQLDQRPKLVTFEQVVMMPTPSEASPLSGSARD